MNHRLTQEQADARATRAGVELLGPYLGSESKICRREWSLRFQDVGVWGCKGCADSAKKLAPKQVEAMALKVGS